MHLQLQMRNFLTILWHFAVSASSLIGSQSSLPDDCEKAQSVFLDSSDKDMPESGSGSHMEPILDHLYHENPRNLNAERSAFGDGVTAIIQGGGGIAKEKSCSDSSHDMSQISGPDGKSKPTPLSQSGFQDPASVGGGQQLTLLSIEVLDYFFFVYVWYFAKLDVLF